MQKEISLDKYAFAGFNANLNDIAGRYSEKQQFLSCIQDWSMDRMLHIPNCSMYLITGPVGYGKVYLTFCFAQTMQEEGYSLYYIDCEDIMEEEYPEEVWNGLLGEIIERTNPEGDAQELFFVYLENLEAVAENRKCIKIVASLLQELYSENCQCILVSTSTEGSGIPTNILKKFIVLELELPDEQERTEYFRNSLGFKIENPYDDEADEGRVFYPLSITGKSENQKNGKFDEQELESLALYCAKKTEGLSFSELDRVILMLYRAFKMKLQEISNGDLEQVYSSVENGEGYFIEPDEFEHIISMVKKTGRLMNPEREKQGKETNVVYVPVPNVTPTLVSAPVPTPSPSTVAKPSLEDKVIEAAADKDMSLIEEENPRVVDVINKHKRVPKASEYRKMMKSEVL